MAATYHPFGEYCIQHEADSWYTSWYRNIKFDLRGKVLHALVQCCVIGSYLLLLARTAIVGVSLADSKRA